jgi:hypothetical protein
LRAEVTIKTKMVIALSLFITRAYVQPGTIG